MKRSFILPKVFNAVVLIFVLSTVSFVFQSCEHCDDEMTNTSSESITPSAERKPVSKTILNLPFFVEGPGQKWWGSLVANDNLYERRMHNQIFGPDGHPVTWGEFSHVTGTAKMNCTGQGSRISLQLNGLIPNGVYSLWIVKFDPPGFDTSYTYVSGFGSAGPNDGSKNAFKASAKGDANLHLATPGGSLSVSGTIGECILTDEYEVHITAIYHMDGQTHGTAPGPAGSYVEQFSFLFLNH
jgi:hypothetical protein